MQQLHTIHLYTSIKKRPGDWNLTQMAQIMKIACTKLWQLSQNYKISNVRIQTVSNWDVKDHKACSIRDTKVTMTIMRNHIKCIKWGQWQNNLILTKKSKKNNRKKYIKWVKTWGNAFICIEGGKLLQHCSLVAKAAHQRSFASWPLGAAVEYSGPEIKWTSSWVFSLCFCSSLQHINTYTHGTGPPDLTNCLFPAFRHNIHLNGKACVILPLLELQKEVLVASLRGRTFDYDQWQRRPWWKLMPRQAKVLRLSPVSRAGAGRTPSSDRTPSPANPFPGSLTQTPGQRCS